MSGKRAAPSAEGGKVRWVKHLLMASAVAVLLTGCGLLAERDVRAYDACVSRHPQDQPLCEGPREAYEVDTSTYQARATAITWPVGGGYQPAPTPVPLPLTRRLLPPVRTGRSAAESLGASAPPKPALLSHSPSALLRDPIHRVAMADRIAGSCPGVSQISTRSP